MVAISQRDAYRWRRRQAHGWLSAGFGIVIFIVTFSTHPSLGQNVTQKFSQRDLQSDTWVGVDALGRTLPVAPRPLRNNRYVGIFYFLTQGTRADHDTAVGPFDRADFIADNSSLLGALHGMLGASFPDYLHAYQHGGPYWWGEPAVGYFLADDPWVHRKNLLMLADAGVDVILLDATNAVLYDAAENSLFSAAEDLEHHGTPVPKFAYVTYAHITDVVPQIYEHFYSTAKYRNLWFLWDGKPLILGNRDALDRNHHPMPAKLRNFFTWRRSWAWTSRPARGKQKWFGNGKDRWPWLDDWPQGYGWHDDPAVPEEVPVAIAGHPVDNLGRSFHGEWGHGGSEPPLDVRLLSRQVARGDYFAQQWKRAIQLNPKFVFVTGWNEWTATRFAQTPHAQVINNAALQLPYFFVDEFNEEFSRDAMPMMNGHQDNYYMQLVGEIRKFKGARPPPVATRWYSIDPAGDFSQWSPVLPEYRHAVGANINRDWPGWGKEYYREDSVRNNIVAAKVACDQKNVCFYVRTESPLSSPDSPNWMQLLIDSDQNPMTGWHGYDLLINRQRSAHNTRASVERWISGKWSFVGSAPIKFAGNELMISVPREIIGMPSNRPTRFDFHWLDNVPVNPDPANFWYRGESAPDGRFNYRFAHKP